MSNVVYAPNHVDVLMEGKDLAVVLRYARISPCTHIRVDHSVTSSRFVVTFTFDDGAACVTRWEDWRVLLDWLAARRSWSVDRVYFAHPGLLADDAKPRADILRKRGTLVLEARA